MATTWEPGARGGQLDRFKTARRDLLRSVCGAVIASALLPRRAAGQAPSAQAPRPLQTGDLQATLTWDTDCTDLDLFLIEPTGHVVAWCSREGCTARLDADNTAGLGPESVSVPAGVAAPGVYTLYVGYYQGHAATTATLRVTTHDGTPRQRQSTITRALAAPDYNETLHAIAQITFPGGAIVEHEGTLPDPAPVPDVWRGCSR